MIDIDVAAPEQLLIAMRTAAQRFRESVGDLQAAWQDDQAGKVWEKLADELDRSANRCEAIIAKHFK